MQRNASSLRLSEDYSLHGNQSSFKCEECGEKFQKPILATISSGGDVQKYYACPRCIAKIAGIEEQKKEEKKQSPFAVRPPSEKAVEKSEKGVVCKQSLGYLKKRPKNMPIPDECLTCEKMIECLV